MWGDIESVVFREGLAGQLSAQFGREDGEAGVQAEEPVYVIFPLMNYGRISYSYFFPLLKK